MGRMFTIAVNRCAFGRVDFVRAKNGVEAASVGEYLQYLYRSQVILTFLHREVFQGQGDVFFYLPVY